MVSKGTRGARLARCLGLVTLLQSRLPFRAKRLADELNVSRRTIFRDLRLIQEAGIVLDFDHEKDGYLIGHEESIRTTPLSHDELRALLVAACSSPLSRDAKLGRLIHQAVGKLLGQAPPRFHRETTNLLNAIVTDSSSPQWADGRGEICSTVFMGLCRKCALRIVYQANVLTDEVIQTKVVPQRLLVCETTWRLVGRSSWHRGRCQIDMRSVVRVELVDMHDDGPEMES